MMSSSVDSRKLAKVLMHFLVDISVFSTIGLCIPSDAFASSRFSDEWNGDVRGSSVVISGETSVQTVRPPKTGRSESVKKPETSQLIENHGKTVENVGRSVPSTTYTWRHLCADNATGNISVACAIAAPDVCPPGEYYGAILAIDAAGVATETGEFGCTGGAPAAAAAGPAPAAGAAPAPAAPPVVIVVTAADFQKLPIPPSTIRLDTQGNTLRTAHTNIYAESSVQTLNTTVLGQPVRVRAIPIEYIWDYGDGSSRRTYSAGSAVGGDPFDVETETSHQFEETGSFPINLTTVYTGQFSVNGGAWIPINGVARVASNTENMTVWKTKRYLVAEDCIANPGAVGCTDG